MAKISRRLGRLGVDWRDAQGKRRWRSFKTEADAQVFLGQTLIEMGRRPTVEPDITLAEYVPRWIGLCAVRVRPSSLVIYRKRLEKHILPALGLHRLRDLRAPVLRDWLTLKASSGMAKSSVAGLLFVLTGVFSMAVEDGLLASNPTEGLSRRLGLGRGREAQDIRAMTAEQVPRFLAAVKARYADYYLDFVLLTALGLRVGEMLGLQWQDVEAKTIRIERQIVSGGTVGPPKTPRSRRVVDLGPEIVEMLRAARVARRQEDLEAGRGETLWIVQPWSEKVSVSDTTTRRRMLGYVMAKALKRAGLPEHFTPHSLRHTFAALHLSAGRPVKWVQEQLGHESISVTVDTYGRWFPTRVPGAADALETTVLPQRDTA